MIETFGRARRSHSAHAAQVARTLHCAFVVKTRQVPSHMEA